MLLDGLATEGVEEQQKRLCDEFHCSAESAKRSTSRHWPDEEAAREELRSKAAYPCLLLQLSFKHKDTFLKFFQLGLRDGIFHSALRKDRSLFSEAVTTNNYSLLKEVFPSTSSKELSTLMECYRRYPILFESNVDIPFRIIPLWESEEKYFEFKRFEEGFDYFVVAEGINHVLGILTTDDNQLPFTDYCNERLFRMDSESLISQLMEEWSIAERLLDYDEGLSAQSRQELMEKIWENSSVSPHNFFGNPPTTSYFRRHKYLTQQRLACCNLHYIRSTLANSFTEAVRRIRMEGLQYPIMAKPACGEANMLVTLCDSEEMLKNVFILSEQGSFEHCYQTKTFVLEEYIEGEEFVVNTMSMKGKAVLTSVWRSRKFPHTCVSHRLSAYAVEQRKEEKKELVSLNTTSILYDWQYLETDARASPVREVVDYIFKCVEAMDIQNGSTHCEVRIDSRGQSPKCGKPVLIEMNSRMQGSLPRCNPFYYYCQVSLNLYNATIASLFHQQHVPPNCSTAVAQPDELVQWGKMYPQMTAEMIPWPITPVYFDKRPCKADDGSPLMRKVVFLISPFDGAMSLRCLLSFQLLPSFSEYSRIPTRILTTPNCIPTVVMTTDLFSCPGAIILEGSAEEIERDAAFIRSAELRDWSGEILAMLEEAVNSSDISAEDLEKLCKIIHETNILYVRKEWFAYFSIHGVFSSFLRV